MKDKRFRQVIGYRLLMALVSFSIVITLITTAIQVYMDYRKYLSDIQEVLIQIEKSYVPTIAASLWVMDKEQLQIEISGITRIPHMIYAEIKTKDKLLASTGSDQSTQIIQRQFPLYYNYDGKNLHIGTLNIIADLKAAYDVLLNRLSVILMFQGIQIFLASMFILCIFQYFVTRHLAVMANHFKHFDPQNWDKKLELHGRTDSPDNPDELDQVVAAINAMSAYLKNTFNELASELKKRQQAEEAQLRLAVAIEQAGESIILIDRDRNIQYVNPAFEKMSGYTREEVIGKNPQILSYDQYDDAFFKRLWNTLEHNKVCTHRIVNKKKDGILYETETTISSVQDNTGNVINYVIIIRDVTHEVRMERQLRQAQKMEAIGTLAGGIAHDFNNILTPIMGYTEMTLMTIPKDDPLRKNLEQVFNAANRAKNLVMQILTFSRQTDQECKPVQISLIIKETSRLLRASLPSTIDIRMNISPDAMYSTVLADPTQIHQILMNLCSNAGYAMREKGGVMEISLINIILDSDFVVQYPDASIGAYIRLSVKDTGHGMDETVKRRIFEPFFTTKPPSQGTGMGLSMIYGIIKSYHGFITLYSEPGKGSIFHVFLPAIETKDNSKKEVSQPIPTGKERILIVDDEEPIVNMERQNLEQLGYEVVARFSSIGALDTFRVRPDRFDLVITDQTMPNMTGAELAKELLKIRPDIPIILCTGFSETIDEEKAKMIGIRGFVMKPVLLADMAKKIRQVLEEKKAYLGLKI